MGTMVRLVWVWVTLAPPGTTEHHSLAGWGHGDTPGPQGPPSHPLVLVSQS